MILAMEGINQRSEIRADVSSLNFPFGGAFFYPWNIYLIGGYSVCIVRLEIGSLDPRGRVRIDAQFHVY